MESRGASPFDEEKLLVVAQKELDEAALWSGTKLQHDRAEAMKAWLSTLRGDEREGRSSVTTREVFEQVEWALAFMVDVWESVDYLVNFEPVGKEDVETAKQATDACHYEFRRCNGSKVLRWAAKDGFISKTGTAKVKFARSRAAQMERYESKSLSEMMQLTNDPAFKLRAVTAYLLNPETGERVEVEPEALDDEAAQMLVLFDVDGVRIDLEGKIEIENIPPENLLHNADAKALDHESCRFIADRIQTSASALIAMGIPQEIVDQLPTSREETSALTSNEEYQARRTQERGLQAHTDRTDSERPLVVFDAYQRVDMDGDGISEWWNLLLGGDYGQILLGYEPCSGHPYVTWTPIEITHRIHGLSLADIAIDLQVTSTSQRRQYLDALYLTTDPTYKVLCQGQDERSSIPMVNLSQLSRAGPGQIVECYGTVDAVSPLLPPVDANTLLPSMEQTQNILQMRTGVAPAASGLDPTKIPEHIYGAMMQSSAAAARSILYTRLFVGEFVVPLFGKIFRELQLNASTRRQLRIHDQWREIDPAAWTTGVDVFPAVPLGHASRAERVAALAEVGEMQARLIEAGRIAMVPDKLLYNTVRGRIEALGFKDTHSYVADPETPEAQAVEVQPTPAEAALELQQQIEAMRLEIERRDGETKWFEAMVQAKKVELDHEAKIQELRIKKEDAVYDAPELSVGGAQ